MIDQHYAISLRFITHRLFLQQFLQDWNPTANIGQPVPRILHVVNFNLCYKFIEPA